MGRNHFGYDKHDPAGRNSGSPLGGGAAGVNPETVRYPNLGRIRTPTRTSPWTGTSSPCTRASGITELVEIAADRVSLPLRSDAYTDASAFSALEAALPGLRSANPREIKRYVNLFRFYSFLTVRRQDGPGGHELAKLAVLAIRRPDLLSALTKDKSAVLHELEAAAAADDAEWERVLTGTGCLIKVDVARRATAASS